MVTRAANVACGAQSPANNSVPFGLIASGLAILAPNAYSRIRFIGGVDAAICAVVYKPGPACIRGNGCSSRGRDLLSTNKEHGLFRAGDVTVTSGSGARRLVISTQERITGGTGTQVPVCCH
jgi:hypothetical protein